MTPASQKPYAEVTFNLPLKEVFTYKIPSEFLGKVEVGMRVFVPFGRRRITGELRQEITMKNPCKLVE